jgi:hypothetical protein
MSTAFVPSTFPPAAPAISGAEPSLCTQLEELKAELVKTTRAFLEQDELAKGTFPSFAEARRASDMAEGLAQDVFELRLRLNSHRDLHGCG